MNENGFDIVHTHLETSKGSKSVIDFCIGRNKYNWQVARLNEGSFDHFPILLSSPFTAGENGVFRKTN